VKKGGFKLLVPTNTSGTRKDMSGRLKGQIKIQRSATVNSGHLAALFTFLHRVHHAPREQHCPPSSRLLSRQPGRTVPENTNGSLSPTRAAATSLRTPFFRRWRRSSHEDFSPSPRKESWSDSPPPGFWPRVDFPLLRLLFSPAVFPIFGLGVD